MVPKISVASQERGALGRDFRQNRAHHSLHWLPPFSPLASPAPLGCLLRMNICPTLCDPKDCSPPVSNIHEILQARTLEWVAEPFSRGSSQPRDRTHILHVSCIAGRFFTTKPPGKPTVLLWYLLILQTEVCMF